MNFCKNWDTYSIYNIHVCNIAVYFNSTVVVRLKSLRVAHMRNTISERGKACVETSRCVAVIWIARLYRLFFTFLRFFFSFKTVRHVNIERTSGVFVSGIYLRQSRGKKTNSKSNVASRLSYHPLNGFHQWQWRGYRINSLSRLNYDASVMMHAKRQILNAIRKYNEAL